MAVFCLMLVLKRVDFTSFQRGVTPVILTPMELGYTEQSFGRNGQTNYGFISQLWLVAIDDVEFIGDPAYSLFADQLLTVQAGDLVIKANADLVQIKFVRLQGTFSESSATTGDGTEYSIVLSSQLPRNEEKLLAWLDTNKKRRWLVIWTDGNGQSYLAGEPGNGLRLSMTRVMGQQNAIQLNLSGKAWHTAWLLEDNDLGTLIPYGQGLYYAN